VRRFNLEVRAELSEAELESFFGVIAKIQKVIDQQQNKEGASSQSEK
jgi:hypothetical protein